MTIYLLRRAARAAPLLLLFSCLLLPGAARAQTTGTIIGVVTDASTGKPVGDCLVVATSPNLQGEQTAMTDDSGNYTITLLPSGHYKLSGQRDGYRVAERNDLEVHLDKTIRANLSLVPDSVQLETQVVSTGTAPVINVGTAETGATISKEFVANVPMARTFQDVAIVAPGAQVDSRGISFAGATSPENNYIVDGLNVSDPAYGILGQNLLTNFIEEVDVKTGAFMPEYGRATGGVINVVTKSGSNEFHGFVFGNITPGFLTPPSKPVFRNDESIATAPVHSGEYDTDFGAEVGGPIVKDKLWFYLGLAPAFTRNVDSRYVQSLVEDPAHPGQPLVDPSTGLTKVVPVPGTTQDYPDFRSSYQAIGKLTYLINENNNVSVSVYAHPQQEPHYLFEPNASADARLQGVDRNSTDANARYSSKMLDKRLILEAEAGWHHQDVNTVFQDDQKTTNQVWWTLYHPLTDFENVPGCAQQGTFTPCQVQNYLTGGFGPWNNYSLDRFSGRLSLSGLFNWLGHHNLKGGVDVEHNSYADTKGVSGPASDPMQIREIQQSPYGTVYQDFRGYGYRNPLDPTTAIYQPSVGVTSVSNSESLYLQDSYSPLDSLTVNGGVRWELQNMSLPGHPLNLNIDNNIAPRVQAIYDFTGTGRSKIAANWGRFYESIPLDMGDRSFGLETQVNALRQQCVTAHPGVGGAPAACPIIPGTNFDQQTGQYLPYNFVGSSSEAVSPNLQGQYVDQFGGSFEYEVITDLSVGITYQGTRMPQVIEDMSVDDGNHYFIANPGISKPFTVTDPATGKPVTFNPQLATSYDPVTGRQYQAAEPKPDRNYDGITFEVRKIFSRHWQAQASYTYSSFSGNYPGLINPATGQLDPNILSEYDLVSLLPNRQGPLPSDSPHQIKLYGNYNFDITSKLNIITGASFRGSSGIPVNYLGAHPTYGPGEAYILPRGSAGETPFWTQTDLKAGIEYVINPPYTIRFTVDVFNVFNQQQTLHVDENWTYDNVQPIVGGQCASHNAASGKDPIASAESDCPELKWLRTTDGRPVTINKNFGRPDYPGGFPGSFLYTRGNGGGGVVPAYQLPLSTRFGLTLTF